MFGGKRFHTRGSDSHATGRHLFGLFPLLVAPLPVRDARMQSHCSGARVSVHLCVCVCYVICVCCLCFLCLCVFLGFRCLLWACVRLCPGVSPLLLFAAWPSCSHSSAADMRAAPRQTPPRLHPIRPRQPHQPQRRSHQRAGERSAQEKERGGAWAAALPHRTRCTARQRTAPAHEGALCHTPAGVQRRAGAVWREKAEAGQRAAITEGCKGVCIHESVHKQATEESAATSWKAHIKEKALSSVQV